MKITVAKAKGHEDHDWATIEGIGLVNLYKELSNNSFAFRWGDTEKDTLKWRFGNYIEVVFDDPERGKWQAKKRIFKNNNIREKILDDKETAICVEYVLSIPKYREALRKYRKDALKRLERSVPRLREEYEESKNRLEALKKVVF